MVFFYFDLPKVSTSSNEDDEDQNVSDYSINSDRNSIDRKPHLHRQHINDSVVERSADYVISSEKNGDLTGSSTVVHGEKQKLVNVNSTGFRKRSRTASVMENWHLAAGWFKYVIIISP